MAHFIVSIKHSSDPTRDYFIHIPDSSLLDGRCNSVVEILKEATAATQSSAQSHSVKGGTETLEENRPAAEAVHKINIINHGSITINLN